MPFLAYFSHSYRWQQKELNHFIWEQLRSDFFFTVDPPDVDRQPMQVSHLEAMMLHSRCFIGLIARREDLGAEPCSPYQLFENALAIRARRPRLLIVSDDIDAALLGPPPDQILRFQPSIGEDGLRWFRRPENADDLRRVIREFVKTVRSTRTPKYTASGPIGLAFPPRENYLPRALFDQFMTSYRRDRKWLDLVGNGNESELLRQAQECSLIVQEVRRTDFTPLDVQGVLHANFRPTIRICRLEENETADELAAAMRLSRNRLEWSAPSPALPLLYSGYRVGPEMQPIVFWKTPEELFAALDQRIPRTRGLRDLETQQEATRYFLGLGRVPGKVFISNEKSLNLFADDLRRDLEEQGVEVFHYSDPQAKHGEPGFPDALKRRIGESAVFLALVNNAYSQSRWCMEELETALTRANEGRLIILPFLLEDKAGMPALISYLDAPDLHEFGRNDAERSKTLGVILDQTRRALDANQRLQFAADERQLLEKLRDRSLDNWRDLLRGFMTRTGVPTVEIEAVLGANEGSNAVAAWERLIELARRSYRGANALGLLLVTRAAETRATHEDGREVDGAIVELVQRHRLVPDVRSMLQPALARREVGIACISTQPTTELFQGIKDRALVNRKATGTSIDDTLFSSLVRVAGTSESWSRQIVDIAAALQGIQAVIEANKSVDETTAADGLIGREDIGYCIVGDEKGLQIPFEWFRRAGSPSPICLEQPIRRSMIGLPKPPSTLRALLVDEQVRPLRALLIGSDAGGVPEVEGEVAIIKERLVERFGQLRWPAGEENITVLVGEVERNALRDHISQGGFDLIHIASHGDIENEKPGLRLKGNRGPYFVSSEELANWVRKAGLRFAYLSCCHGAAPEAGAGAQPIRRFDNLIQAFIKESVPEVIGFVWPIRDRDSLRFAASFYTSFLSDFRASRALLEARRAFQTSERIWAAPVLYSQADTRYT